MSSNSWLLPRPAAIEQRSGHRFRYFADGLFIAAVLIYLVNRFWAKKTTWGRTGFCHDYLNDVLLIPFFLPGVLWLHRRLGLRSHDRPPRLGEVALHVGVWSICFEWLFARYHVFYQHSTADPKDALAYAVGGGIAWMIWNLERFSSRSSGQSSS
ncbi:MAG TPA: hypothetical protein VFE47_26005 [Tepidisphaeraceae bacterium]|jgi:hypothetical protein|nr:hypothetical protein [Tepidisphaeraceae bacterium]